MKDILSGLVCERIEQFGTDNISKRALDTILPKEEDIQKIDNVSEAIAIYRLKNSDSLYIMTVDPNSASVQITKLDDNIASIESIEKLSIENGETVYKSFNQINDEKGVIITGANSKLEEKFGRIVPKNILTGIWFYDRQFIDNIDKCSTFMKYLSGKLNPIVELTDFNIENYQRYQVSPEMYQSANFNRSRTFEIKDNATYIGTIETYNSNIYERRFAYALDDDFRTPIRGLYNSTISVNDIDDVVFAISGIEESNKNNLGLFNIHSIKQNKKKSDNDSFQLEKK